MRVGRELNSPSLMADAAEYRAHVFSSGVVLLALIGNMIGIALDRYAALLIVVLIAKTGWELLSDGMRVLLDASLDAETLDKVRKIINSDPGVTQILSLVGRNAGRYRFLEAEVSLRVENLEKAHAVSQRIERAIRDQVPHVDRVLLHYEPQVRTFVRYAAPLADVNGTVSKHFGEAPFFGLVTVRVANHQTERQEVLANPYKDEEKAKGIRVAEWLVDLKTDRVLLQENVQGRGPAYVFADAGVTIHQIGVPSLSEAVAEVMDHAHL
jgi:predicted Fe-Mo cluster-binding NifX family protein